MRIAIIIPVYNAEKYISDCLDSLIAQIFTNWTAYCVDDGSTDNSLKILEKYSHLDSRIKVFHKSNGGASSARNFALDHLYNEDWLSFVDIDDFVSPYFYDRIVNAINNNDDIDYVRLYCTHTDLRYNEILEKGLLQEQEQTIDGKIISNIEYFLKNRIGGYICSLFIKSAIVRNNGLKFPEDMKLLEDQLFSINCALLSKKMLYLRKPNNYYYYSGNTQSITKSKIDKRSDIVLCINRVFSLFESKGDKRLIDDFFYSKFLPGKIDSLLSMSLQLKQKYSGNPLSNTITIRYRSLSNKTLIKFLFAKILRLI